MLSIGRDSWRDPSSRPSPRKNGEKGKKPVAAYAIALHSPQPAH
jgi:hypothetical protein